jgi:hypothetical protein
VLLVAPDVSQPPAVGRNRRIADLAQASGQPPRRAARRVDAPEIVVADENDGITPNARLPKVPSLRHEGRFCHRCGRVGLFLHGCGKGAGDYNWGGYRNAKLDAFIDAARIESDPGKRKKLIADALAEHNAQIHHVPLHRQVIPWALRSNIRVVHRADNWLETQWVHID